MKTIILFLSLALSSLAVAKETDPRVVDAMAARAVAHAAVLDAQVALAQARAKLAAEAAKVAEVKATVARERLR